MKKSFITLGPGIHLECSFRSAFAIPFVCLSVCLSVLSSIHQSTRPCSAAGYASLTADPLGLEFDPGRGD